MITEDRAPTVAAASINDLSPFPGAFEPGRDDRADVADDHSRTLASEVDRLGATESIGRARNDGNLAFQS